ncbi:hypothetical protein GF371_04445 [Candidatus Woesearchaeota archaeon]|nr:hypothetical protein [Candidatus Woesearchaeota archaeon]
MSQLYQHLMWVPKDAPLTGESLKNELYSLLDLYRVVQKSKGKIVQFDRFDGKNPEQLDEKDFLTSAVAILRNPNSSRKPVIVARFPGTAINSVPGIGYGLGGFVLDTSALAKAVGNWDQDIVPGLFTCKHYVHGRFEEEEDGAAIGICRPPGVEKGTSVVHRCYGQSGCEYENKRFGENIPSKLADIIAAVIAGKK